MLESSRAALEYTQGKTRDDFSRDPMLQDAVVRRLEIIGEASGRVSEETQQKYPHLPWQAMKGTRNKIIHEYDSIELSIIWDILQQDLAELEKLVS
ncbi:MAG: DUF86 domain-containing protein [Chloroflexi bacterium]|nr:DUF86 domain-containing protein [Chloroflexota bacterium]